MKRAVRQWAVLMAGALCALGLAGCGDSSGSDGDVAVPLLTESFGEGVYRFVTESSNAAPERSTLWLSGRGSNGIYLFIVQSDDMASQCTAQLSGEAVSPTEMRVTRGIVNLNETETLWDDDTKPATGTVTLEGDWLVGKNIRVGLFSGCRFEFRGQLDGRIDYWDPENPFTK